MFDSVDYEKIYKELEKYHLYPDDIRAYFDGDMGYARVIVSIINGDWKHEHLKCDMIMRDMGYIPDGSIVTEEDGSDCYSADRYYRKGEVIR